MIKLSAVIITCNEERNIERCLISLLPIVDEIVVVDSYSTDTTVSIAKKHGALIFCHKFQGHIEQKNFALSKASFPYVLSVDADEIISEQLQKSIINVKKNWVADGYYFNRLTNYCGKFIKYSSWYPSRKLRLWDKSKGCWGGYNPHDKFVMDKKAKKKFLQGDLLHFPYKTIDEHLNKIEQYSGIYADYQYRNGNKGFTHNTIINPLWRFFRDYLLKLGILDGMAGFMVCWLSSYETFLKYRKLISLQQSERLLENKKPKQLSNSQKSKKQKQKHTKKIKQNEILKINNFISRLTGNTEHSYGPDQPKPFKRFGRFKKAG